MGFLLFLVFVFAAFLVSPWFLFGSVAIVLLTAWANAGRRF